MYGRLHERKLKQDDFIMSCQKARKQLDQYVDIQAKRVNIDSAKKRAVLQHMDYQGFRQMVLGANIFPTKSKQLYNFSKGQNSDIPINKFFIQPQNKKQLKQKQHFQRQKLTQSQKQIFKNVQGKSQLLCNSFREFKKKFNSDYPLNSNQQITLQKAQTLYNLIKNQDTNRLTKIFNMQCQANILIKIVNLFEFIIKYLKQNDSQGKIIKEIAYQIKFFQIILKLKNMIDFNLSILSKKQRSKIIQFLIIAKQILLGIFRKNENIKAEQNKQIIQQSEQYLSKRAQDQKTIDELIKIIDKK